jgi:hypothetical protein
VLRDCGLGTGVRGPRREALNRRVYLSRSLAWNQERRFTFPDRALRRGAVQCPFSEACWISDLREYGVCATTQRLFAGSPFGLGRQGGSVPVAQAALEALAVPVNREPLRAEPEALICVAAVV